MLNIVGVAQFAGPHRLIYLFRSVGWFAIRVSVNSDLFVALSKVSACLVFHLLIAKRLKHCYERLKRFSLRETGGPSVVRMECRPVLMIDDIGCKSDAVIICRAIALD